MGIICNGVQRSGTHLLAKVFDLCGHYHYPGILQTNYYKARTSNERSVPAEEFLSKMDHQSCVIAHAGSALTRSGHKLIQIIRDPRDWVVSTARFKARSVDPIPPDWAISVAMDQLERHWWHIPWLWKSDLVVRFEDLARHDIKTIDDILSAADCDFASAQHIASKLTGSRTWTGQLSDWRIVFKDYHRQQFDAKGGSLLMGVYGYGWAE